MSYKAFEFSLKTEYVFAEHAADAAEEDDDRHERKYITAESGQQTGNLAGEK